MSAKTHNGVIRRGQDDIEFFVDEIAMVIRSSADLITDKLALDLGQFLRILPVLTLKYR